MREGSGIKIINLRYICTNLESCGNLGIAIGLELEFEEGFGEFAG